MKDYFVTVLTNTGLECFLWVYDYPIEESNHPIFFRDKIIVEVNDGETILFKICENCFTQLTTETNFECSDCNHK